MKGIYGTEPYDDHLRSYSSADMIQKNPVRLAQVWWENERQ